MILSFTNEGKLFKLNYQDAKLEAFFDSNKPTILSLETPFLIIFSNEFKFSSTLPNTLENIKAIIIYDGESKKSIGSQPKATLYHEKVNQLLDLVKNLNYVQLIHHTNQPQEILEAISSCNVLKNIDLIKAIHQYDHPRNKPYIATINIIIAIDYEKVVETEMKGLRINRFLEEKLCFLHDIHDGKLTQQKIKQEYEDLINNLNSENKKIVESIGINDTYNKDSSEHHSALVSVRDAVLALKE